MSTTATTHEALRAHIRAAAEAFASESRPLAEILEGLVNDVERAMREPLEIFPVCHHSPSSAVHMVRRLRENPPQIIFMECCEDLRPLLDGLSECTLPVALQAFASKTDGFPPDWSPLSLVCPLSEFSAEFQAIAFALSNPDTVELVFVDRSADHVYQWKPKKDEASSDEPTESPSDEEETLAIPHGSGQRVDLGSSTPTLDEFTEVLLRNARVAHYSEWWDQYIETPAIRSDYAHYREVFFLAGSLIRRLGRRDEDIAEDEMRERFMWTRMKQHLASRKLPPQAALYICGAAHAASRVEEFGWESSAVWDIPPKTATEWLYGLLPSSYATIERQFTHPPGSMSLAENLWRSELRRSKLTPFRLAKKEEPTEGTEKTLKAKKNRAIPAALPPERTGELLSFLAEPPPPAEEDQDTLLTWCTGIVSLARRHGYMSSTADSIAIYQTSIFLANLRNRQHPTPWDFRDAAVTCLEKDIVPKRRDVGRLCDQLLGGDRIGRVGYDSMPPLARDVYDRLKCLPVQLEARNIQRALLDFTKHPEWVPASDLLWKLRCLLPAEVVRPIMGQRVLGGSPPAQESWDLAIGRHQGTIIQLGYEGVTVEFVLEQRLRQKAFATDARTVDALEAVEQSILFLKSARLTADLGARARVLLVSEPDVRDAAVIYSRIARLVHYYRSFTALPDWCADFVTTGYSHYSALLPAAFNDRSIHPADLAAMLQFILTLESLALSLGCERSELVIAIRHSASGCEDPIKLALLWSVECVLQLRSLADLRARFDRSLENTASLHALPAWLNGFLLSLSFTPVMGGLTVELMSKAFALLPDEVLMPWLPALLMSLRDHAQTSGALGTLLKEASAQFPRSLDALGKWTPPWEKRADVKVVANSTNTRGSLFLYKHPATANALARLLGQPEGWSEATDIEPAHELGSPLLILNRHPTSAQALAALCQK